MAEDQRQKIISLLETAQMLAEEMEEGTLAYLIKRAVDEAQAGAFPQEPQASSLLPNLKTRRHCCHRVMWSGSAACVGYRASSENFTPNSCSRNALVAG